MATDETPTPLSSANASYAQLTRAIELGKDRLMQEIILEQSEYLDFENLVEVLNYTVPQSFWQRHDFGVPGIQIKRNILEATARHLVLNNLVRFVTVERGFVRGRNVPPAARPSATRGVIPNVPDVPEPLRRLQPRSSFDSRIISRLNRFSVPDRTVGPANLGPRAYGTIPFIGTRNNRLTPSSHDGPAQNTRSLTRARQAPPSARQPMPASNASVRQTTTTCIQLGTQRPPVPARQPMPASDASIRQTTTTPRQFESRNLFSSARPMPVVNEYVRPPITTSQPLASPGPSASSQPSISSVHQAVTTPQPLGTRSPSASVEPCTPASDASAYQSATTPQPLDTQGPSFEAEVEPPTLAPNASVHQTVITPQPLGIRSPSPSVEPPTPAIVSSVYQSVTSPQPLGIQSPSASVEPSPPASNASHQTITPSQPLGTRSPSASAEPSTPANNASEHQSTDPSWPFSPFNEEEFLASFSAHWNAGLLPGLGMNEITNAQGDIYPGMGPGYNSGTERMIREEDIPPPFRQLPMISPTPNFASTGNVPSPSTGENSPPHNALPSTPQTQTTSRATIRGNSPLTRAMIPAKQSSVAQADPVPSPPPTPKRRPRGAHSRHVYCVKFVREEISTSVTLSMWMSHVRFAADIEFHLGAQKSCMVWMKSLIHHPQFTSLYGRYPTAQERVADVQSLGANPAYPRLPLEDAMLCADKWKITERMEPFFDALKTYNSSTWADCRLQDIKCCETWFNMHESYFLEAFQAHMNRRHEQHVNKRDDEDFTDLWFCSSCYEVHFHEWDCLEHVIDNHIT